MATLGVRREKILVGFCGFVVFGCWSVLWREVVVVGCCYLIEMQSPQSVLTQIVNKVFKSELYRFPGVDAVCGLWRGFFGWAFLLCLHAERMSFCHNFS